MQAFRADKAVRILTTLVTIAYFGLWAGAVLVLVAAPAIKLLAAADSDFNFGLPVRAEMRDADAVVRTKWGGARLEVEDVRGSLEVPISAIPWTVFSAVWAYVAAAMALTLLFLHGLRGILRHARDGTPFDPDNAGRLRSLGLVALALAVLQGLAELLTALVVRRGLGDSNLDVQTGIHFNGPLVLLALVLLTLAEIFRRGAELEYEQSLVL